MSEFLRIAERLFEDHRRPMSARELVDLAKDEGLFSDKFVGKTPHQTMKSKLSVHIRKQGVDSVFIRTAPGVFYLRALLRYPEELYQARPWQPPPSRERVLVFPSRWLDDHSYRFQGVRKSWKRLAGHLLDGSVCRYLDRLDAEHSQEYKQLLTYIMVTKEGQILAFTRGVFSRTEDYLRGAHCIGFGGHVAETDNTLFSSDLGIIDNAVRELSEELRLPANDKQRLLHSEGLKIVGILNDDSSATGRRHFAFLLQYEVGSDPAWRRPERGEKSITQLRWLDPQSSSFSIRDYEYWSQLCLREYFAPLVRVQPSYIVRRRKPLTPPHLLCVMGTLGSGKSEATRVLTTEFGYTEVNSGLVLAELLGMQPVSEKDRLSFQKAAWEFISRSEGPMELASAMWDKVALHACDRILIDGIRQRATLDALRQLAGSRRIGLLYVYTPPDMAFQFYRSRVGGDCTIHDFLTALDSPVEREVRKLIGICDAVLYNWMGRDTYRDAIRALMNEVDLLH